MHLRAHCNPPVQVAVAAVVPAAALRAAVAVAQAAVAVAALLVEHRAVRPAELLRLNSSPLEKKGRQTLCRPFFYGNPFAIFWRYFT